jgi:hypothetical protein
MNHLAEHVVPTRYSSVGQRDPALAVEARLFRHAEALDMLGGDEQLMHEVVVIAMAELVRQRDALREALISSDAPTARRVSKRGLEIYPDSYAGSCINVLVSICSKHESGDLARKLEGRSQGFPRRGYGRHGSPAFPGSVRSRPR